MTMHLPDLNYECVHCGYSCQRLDVELTGPEFETLRQQIDAEAVEERNDRYWLRKRECGACHFLLDSGPGRCGLHRQHGMAAKPRPCLEFPFRAVATPGGVFVGASFACQAILERSGPAVTRETLSQPAMALPDYPLAPGVDFDWQRYTRWEQRAGDLLCEQGQNGLWTAPLEIAVELLGGTARRPTPHLEDQLQTVFRGLMALAEGPMDSETLLLFLQAHSEQGSYTSSILHRPVNVAAVLAAWEEPWSLWPEALPFFEHLLFRKYLLEGPDAFSRLCSLPIMAQILQFLVLARAQGRVADVTDLHWALRLLEERLTFHARGLDRYLGRCGSAFLEGLV